MDDTIYGTSNGQNPLDASGQGYKTLSGQHLFDFDCNSVSYEKL
jgi:hypothetical protein